MLYGVVCCMNNLLDEIIAEANFGKISIDGDDFQVAFNTVIYENNKQIFNNLKDNNFPSLVIKNKNIFLQKSMEYINLFIEKGRRTPSFSKDINYNKMKLIMSYIFANATTEDFLNPIQLLEKHINYLKDETFSYFNDEFKTESLTYFNNSTIQIKNSVQSVFMETPNKIELSFHQTINDQDVHYNLPSISYGITEENGEKVCYIYTLLQPKSKEQPNELQQTYEKKISREMYKLNSGISNLESDEYKSFIQKENDYYPENISDVSPSAIISLVIFISLLEKENITRIKAVPYLPIRFLSRDLSLNEIETKEKIDEMNQRNQLIQRNITDKFIRTFRRVSFHFPKLNIQYFPYEVSEFMEISLSNFDNHFNNPILEDIYNTSNNAIIKRKNHR